MEKFRYEEEKKLSVSGDTINLRERKVLQVKLKSEKTKTKKAKKPEKPYVSIKRSTGIFMVEAPAGRPPRVVIEDSHGIALVGPNLQKEDRQAFCNAVKSFPDNFWDNLSKSVVYNEPDALSLSKTKK